MSSPSDDRYCVIGAGASGLAQARAFRALGIPFEVLERHGDVGGIWDMANPGTPMYQSAHLISSRDLSAFAGFPMPSEYPDYPRRDQVLAYLRSFADAYELRRFVSFGTPVERVIPDADGATVWVKGQPRRYAGVVCATGWQWHPHMPTFTGQFRGVVRHSHSYTSPEEFRGKRVLIVGLGNSAADIACDAAQFAAQTTVSVRRGYYFLPKHVFGKPLDVFGERSPPLPRWLEDRLFGFIQRLLIGDVTTLGMPKPDYALTAAHPLVNDQLLHHLRHGDVQLKGNIARLDGQEVVFTDGSRLVADEILCATGYTMELPYLDDKYVERVERSISHYLTCFSRKLPTLCTLGTAELDAALFPHVDRWAFLMANYARAHAAAPDQAAAFRKIVETETPDLSGGRKMIASPRHAYYCHHKPLRRHTLAVFRRMGWAEPSKMDLRPGSASSDPRTVTR